MAPKNIDSANEKHAYELFDTTSGISVCGLHHPVCVGNASSKRTYSVGSKETWQDNYARDNARSGANRGAIVGGTVAAGIVICFTVFFGVLVLKKYLVPQGKCNKRIVDAKSLRPGAETPGTTTSAHTSWRQTFNHRISVPYADSVYSQRSLGNTTAATRMSRASAQPTPLPTVPSKAAQILGVGNKKLATPPAKAPLSSPRLPITPLSENFMPETPILQYSSSQSSPKQSPLRRNPPLLPPPQNPPPQGPLPPVPTHEPPANGYSKSSRCPPGRASSVCTMSTLGMELLRDVMQPRDSTTFSPPPEKASFFRSPPPMSKTNQPPQTARRNSKGQNTVPDRRDKEQNEEYYQLQGGKGVTRLFEGWTILSRLQ
ncbi:hypothetical protein FCIRC_7628 [Fusarium circinatum]|uniref:Uncharacterized protein n=1 Tax=Fusarium circinatum TaxID=48490 RepID=A0A8H5TRQ6_FUSCI|nr:hypothetical protein FCIRC_7628 [Fusarium circinatum]